MHDALIIGGGVIGLLTARELHMAGLEVTLIDRGDLARESSWAGGGIISPLYPWRYPDSITRLASHGQQTYADLCEQLLADTGIDPQYTRSGLLIHADDELLPAQRWAKQCGTRLDIIDASTLSRLEPERIHPPSTAMWMPDVAQVRNPRLVKALIKDLQQRGVDMRPHNPATGLMLGESQLLGIQTPTGPIQADITILAMGAWTGEFSQMLPNPADIRPVRGQMLLFRGQPDVIRHMMLEENRYVIPRRDGRILFGSTLEETGFEKTITEGARQELAQLAIQRYPVLDQYEIEHHWAGLRPAAPAGVPYICRHPQIDNLFINAGHYRNGVVLGPASAKLLADLVLGRKPVVDPAPYALDAPRG